MGCCESIFFRKLDSAHKCNYTQNNRVTHTNNGPSSSSNEGKDSLAGKASDLSDFSDFSLAELKAATNNFNSDFVVSESGEKAPNVVYKGRLQNDNNHRWIAIKKFPKLAWPDHKQFADEARGVGDLRHKRLANLIRYCCDGKEEPDY